MSYREGNKQECDGKVSETEVRILSTMSHREGEAAASRRSKVTSERVALLVLSCLLAAAAIVIYRLYNPGPKCKRGWEQHGGKCYLFSTNGMSWKRSRRFCQQQGGDLVKINSREEQSFLENQLRKEMNFDDDKFWIGLTDSEEEGRWLWVDGSELDTSLTFWSFGEPDDWKEKGSDGEDCASMGERAGAYDLKCWFDRPCYMDQSIICEKTP